MKCIRLIDWITHRLMNVDVMSPERVNKLYRHYHRMRLWEASVAERGSKNCPDRSV
jgi:hypothetical protein